MNFQPIQFDQAEALKAGGGSHFFDGNTEQRVKITRAEFVKTSTGTDSLMIDVINNDKKRGYFALNYGSNDIAYRQLQQLMGVVGAKTLTPTNMPVPKYDSHSKDTVTVSCINAAELVGKVFVGLFINRYSVYQGEVKQKTELYVPFNTSRQTYTEMVNNQTATEIERLLPMMVNSSNESKQKAESQLNGGGYNPAMGGGYDVGMTDGIPNQFVNGSQQSQSTTYQRAPAPNQTQPMHHQQPMQNVQGGAGIPQGSAMADPSDIPF